jgi:hypothetical protein
LGAVLGEEDYWVIRIPKPKRLVKALSKALQSFAGSNITIDIPLIMFTSFFMGVVAFLIFTLAVRIPEWISVVFASVLVAVYLFSVLPLFRRYSQ